METMNLCFAFWNLGKNPKIGARAAQLCENHAVDVLIVAEAGDASVVHSALTSNGMDFLRPYSNSTKLAVFTRSGKTTAFAGFDDASGRLSIFRLSVEGALGLSLAVVHLQSKVNWSDTDQDLALTEIRRDVERFEGTEGHTRTLVVGDFNTNPFSAGIAGAVGMHAVMSLSIAEGGGRTVAGREYGYFYNPMWSLFGDKNSGPPGTHFFRTGKPLIYFWNMYDQVLLRPVLARYLTAVRILDHDGRDTLLTNRGLPDGARASDHLPIIFRLSDEVPHER
jgi:hypothetical protein